MAVHVELNIANKRTANSKSQDFRAACRNLQNSTLQSGMLDIMNPSRKNFKYINYWGGGGGGVVDLWQSKWEKEK